MSPRVLSQSLLIDFSPQFWRRDYSTSLGELAVDHIAIEFVPAGLSGRTEEANAQVIEVTAMICLDRPNLADWLISGVKHYEPI